MTRLTSLLAALLALSAARAGAQASPYVPLDDVAYGYIDALMARGGLMRLSALERPYTVAAIRQALAAPEATGGRVERRWAQALGDRIAKYDVANPAVDGNGARVALSAGGLVTVQSTGRRDLLQDGPHGGTRPGASLRFALAAGPFVGVSPRVDQLCIDADATADAPHRAFQNVRNP